MKRTTAIIIRITHVILTILFVAPRLSRKTTFTTYRTALAPSPHPTIHLYMFVSCLHTPPANPISVVIMDNVRATIVLFTIMAFFVSFFMAMMLFVSVILYLLTYFFQVI